jgi:hypothetical protein
VAGATVIISELGLVTRAGADGTFNFPSVPEGRFHRGLPANPAIPPTCVSLT